MSASLPERIGPYTVVSLLGEGGMGRVYLAKRIAAGGFEKLCVVKTIRPDSAESERFSTVLMHEARISASLQHQNIVQVFDFDRTEDAIYMAMEYVEGYDLESVIQAARKRNETIPLHLALTVAAEALKGLQHVANRRDADGRSLNLVHRDLTPRNILISKEGEVKIADFGIAKAATAPSDTRTGELKGKLHYLAPEQIDGRQVDPRTDLFALGVVLYEMLTGCKPFHADSASSLLARIVRCDFKPASSLAELPPEIDELLDRIICPDPEQRFESAAQMLDAVRRILNKLDLLSLGLADYLRDLESAGALKHGGAKQMPQRVAHKGQTITVHREVQPKGDRGQVLLDERTKAMPATWTRRPRLIGKILLGAIASALLICLAWLALHRLSRNEQANTATSAAALLVANLESSSSAIRAALAAQQAVALSQPSISPTPAPTPRPTPTPAPNTPTPAATVEPNLTVALDPGSLGVDLDPWADVYVDGVYRDKTPTLIKLDPGKHTVTLENPGLGLSKTISVRIEPGQRTSITRWP